MKIAICADHGGFDLKEKLKTAYPDIDWLDIGAGTFDPDDDYPDYAFTLAVAVAEGHADRGIAICGSGVGASMALNRHPMIRAALCADPEIARLARDHNDANVLCLPGRFIDLAAARMMVDMFIQTPFSQGERHIRRVRKLSLMDDEHVHNHDHEHGGCCGGGCH